MILDRRKAPVASEIKELSFPKLDTVSLSSGCNMYYIAKDDQEALKIQIVFNAGTKFQEKPLVASLTNSLITEGTNRLSSKEIAELFDNEGAFLETECEPDSASVTLYCLSKSIKKLIPLLKELITTAVFSQKELENRLAIQRQKFKVNSQKVSFVAKKEFLPFILGAENPYSNQVSEADFDNVTCEDLQRFYKTHYLNNSFDIYLSGRVDPSTVKVVKEEWGGWSCNDSNVIRSSYDISNDKRESLLIEKQGALQSAIRIGCPTIGKSHKDFSKFLVTNTLLGGYFGSRLMANIREDKGYTYGIGSGIITLKELAYFVISTEVGAEVTKAALSEIEKELKILSDTYVSDRELSLVKNYMNGSIMRSFDGPFSAMDRFISMHKLGLIDSYYSNLFKEINSVTKEDVLGVSQKYFSYSAMKKVMVGKV